MKNASRVKEPTMAEYDRTLAVLDIDGNPMDLPLMDGHQASCHDGRHATGCIHAADCTGGPRSDAPNGTQSSVGCRCGSVGCRCGLPNWPREILP